MGRCIYWLLRNGIHINISTKEHVFLSKNDQCMNILYLPKDIFFVSPKTLWYLAIAWCTGIILYQFVNSLKKSTYIAWWVHHHSANQQCIFWGFSIGADMVRVCIKKDITPTIISNNLCSKIWKSSAVSFIWPIVLN